MAESQGEMRSETEKSRDRASRTIRKEKRKRQGGREAEWHRENPLKARTGSQSLVHQPGRRKSCLINGCSLGKVFLIPGVD